MFKMIRVVVSVVLVGTLSACATMSPVKTEEQEQKVRMAKINAQVGIAYLERHNTQRAKQKLLLALEQAPNIPETWYSMAYFLEATGSKDDASIYYQKAISLAPTRGDAQNNYGTFLCRNGEYRESVEHFALAVKDSAYLDPADAYENAGLCASKIPDQKLAAKYFSQALKQDPSRSVSQKKLAELNKYLAMNGERPYPESAAPVQDAVPEIVAASNVSVIPNEVQAAPKRIAYNSLRQRQDEEESEEESGLVKIPELLKARPAAVAQAESVTQPRSRAVSKEPKIKMLAATKPEVTTQLKKAVAHQFHVEHVALKPLPKNGKAIKTVAKLKPKRESKVVMAKPAKPQPIKVARSVKKVEVAKLSKPKKIKIAHAISAKKQVLAKKDLPTKGVVTV